MDISMVTISLKEYERLKGIEERYNITYVNLLYTEMEEWKQKAEDNKRILESWTKGFDRSAKNERRSLVKWLHHYLHSHCNKLGLLSKKKLETLLVNNKEVEDYIENKETFFDWAIKN